MLAVASLLLLGVELLRSAWVCDDAFITLRSIDNFLNGYGLRWNAVERVQSYTHPLWMMLLGVAYAITREPYYTMVALSLACAAGTVALFFLRLPLAAAVPAVLLMAASRGFIDYSTSGLENTLSHLLLAAFGLALLREPTVADRGGADAERGVHDRTRLLRIGLLGALAVLNRMDFVLLVAPAVLLEGHRVQRDIGRPRALGILAIAAAPLVLWHLFTLLYYGFPFPNTAYAKLGHGYARMQMVSQGFWYLMEALRRDPVTMLVPIAALVAAVVRRTSASLAIGCGLALHLAYVVWIGGDYMSGRFLTPAFTLGLVLLAWRAPREWPRLVPAGVAACLLLALLPPLSPLRIWSPLPRALNNQFALPEPYHSIADERRFYYGSTGLIPVLEGVRITDHPWAGHGRSRFGLPHAIEFGAIGMLAYYAGPAMHVVDPFGLADPLTARLPSAPGARIGHFHRKVPAGYLATLQSCMARRFPRGTLTPTPDTCLTLWRAINRIEDPAVGHAYHELLRITQAPLFNRDRLWTIARWNLGLSGVPRPADNNRPADDSLRP